MAFIVTPFFCFRDDNDTIQPTSVLETWLGSYTCSMRLSVGKTYVLAGGWHVNDGNELVMDTYACEYFKRYETDVDVKMPSCENYPEPAPPNSKRAQGYAGPANFAAPVNNKRSQGHGGPPKFDIMKAARRAMNPFRLVCIVMIWSDLRQQRFMDKHLRSMSLITLTNSLITRERSEMIKNNWVAIRKMRDAFR